MPEEDKNNKELLKLKSSEMKEELWTESGLIQKNKPDVWKSVFLTYFEVIFRYAGMMGMMPMGAASQGLMTGLHEVVEPGCNPSN